MKLIDKINNLNKYISFNLLALDGYVILILAIFYIRYINTNFKLYGHGSWEATCGWLLIVLVSIALIPIILAFIFRLIESVCKIEIKNKYFLKKPIILFLRYLGAIITFIFLIFIFIFIFIFPIIMNFNQGELIYTS